jgi:hypothetical protein
MKRLLCFGIGTLSLLASVFLTSNAMAHDHHEYKGPSFGSFYTEATSTIAISTLVPLSVTQASSRDVSMNGSGIITLHTPGYYYVNYGASQNVPGEPMQVQLALGGVPVTGAILASNPVPEGLLSTSSIIYVAEPYTELTLENTHASVALSLGTAIVDAPTAFVSLFRVSH